MVRTLVFAALALCCGVAAAQQATPPPGYVLVSPPKAPQCGAGLVFDASTAKCLAACEPGHHREEGGCVKDVAQVVERRWYGCPGGYVDHPFDPKKCALPVIAERILARARR